MKTSPGTWRSETWLLIFTIILSLLGVLFVFEASVAEAYSQFGNQFYFARQQLMWLGVGMMGLAVGMHVPVKFWKFIAPWAYGFGILCMLLVFVPHIGVEVNGARRWLQLPGFRFQPVEIVKFSMILFFASWMEKHQKLGPFLFLTLIPVGLLFLQPDMGSALIVVMIAFGLYFLAGAPLKTFAWTGVAGVAFLLLMIVISPYRLRRLTSYFNPESDPLGASFHIRQIVIALGNGGIFGQGIGKSRQKFNYIPEASTDSIFAIIAEEIGYVGSLGIFTLFLLFFLSLYRVIKRLPARKYEYLLVSGIFLWLAAQCVLNLSAIVALVPLTGIPLPFFSYGGTALVMVLSITGIAIGIGRRTK